jgi:PAS domain S-box-containing protein
MTFFNTIRGRLVLLVLLVIVPALAVQVFGAWRDLRGDIAARKLESVRVVSRAASDFETLVTETRTVFTDLVRANEMRSPGNCTQVFTALRFAYERLAPETTNLGLADTQGNIYCAIISLQGEKNLAGRPEFQAAIRTMDLAVGSYAANPLSGSPQVSVAYPVLSYNGRVQAVIFATVATRWLEKWQNESTLPAGSVVTLFAADGRPLWRAIDGEAAPVQAAGATGVTWFDTLKAGGVIEGPDFDGALRLHTVLPLQLNNQVAGYVHLGYPVAQLYSQAYHDLRWKLVLLGLVLLVALAFAWQGSERLFLHPMRDLSAAVQRVQAGDLSARASRVRGLGEVTGLAQAFDRMADTLQQREAERQQMAERFRAAFESSAIGMGLLSLEGQILAVNAAVCEMSGYTEEELLLRNDNENVYPPDAQVGMDRFDEMLDGKLGYYNVERRYLRKGGEVFWARLTLSLVRDPQGQPAYLVALIEDIDEQKRKGAALAEAASRFRAVFDNPAVGVAVMTLDRRIVQINPTAERLTGYTPEEIAGVNPSDLVVADDRYLDRELFEELVAGERDQYLMEKRYLRKDGSLFWGRVNFALVRDEAGRPLYIIGLIEDITEEKAAQQKVAESEARFRAMYENAAIGISLIAPDGRMLAANPVLVQLSGYSEAELVAAGGLGITHPEDLDVGRHEFAEVLAGKRNSFQVEKRYVHKDGRVHWMRQSISSVCDAAGEVLYLVVIAEDIDERKRASEELRESEARFRAMYNNAAVGMAMMSLDRRIIGVNETSARITGYSVAELVNTNPGRLSHPDDIAVGMDQFGDLVAGRIPQLQMEKRFIRKNGEVFWGRVSYSVVPGKDGRPEYLVGLIEDITEEREAGRTLAESEARFRTLYDSAEMGIVLVDLGNDGNLPLDEIRFHHLVANQRLNPAMLRMFGFTAEELKNTAIASLIYPEDQGIDARQFRQLLTGEIDSFRIEKRFVRKDGSVFWGRLTDSLARTADGTPQMVIGIIEDISAEHHAKERLASQEAEHRHQLEQRIAERTEELNAANERLAAKAAQDAVAAERTRLARDLHDAVTQTLFSTTLIAEVLPDLWEMNRTEGLRRLEELRQLTRGALAEMRTLLVELRPNALVEVPLSVLLRQLTDAMIGRARIAIQLSAEGDAAGGPRLPADVQVGLYRIAQEALNNVVKHAKATQAVVTLRQGETVRLTVADNGAGFDPGAVTADHLGLKIMRERAEAIGAKLNIYSEPGDGTQVSVVWEVKREA